MRSAAPLVTSPRSFTTLGHKFCHSQQYLLGYHRILFTFPQCMRFGLCLDVRAPVRATTNLYLFSCYLFGVSACGCARTRGPGRRESIQMSAERVLLCARCANIIFKCHPIKFRCWRKPSIKQRSTTVSISFRSNIADIRLCRRACMPVLCELGWSWIICFNPYPSVRLRWMRQSTFQQPPHSSQSQIKKSAASKDSSLVRNSICLSLCDAASVGYRQTTAVSLHTHTRASAYH